MQERCFIPKNKDLTSLFPAVAEQWDYEKNGELLPSQVTVGSHKRVWWVCEKGHSWRAQIQNRTVGDSGCPYCAGKVSVPGETDLATLYPDVAQEWDYEKNGELLPSQVAAKSNKSVWWVCEKGHSWRAQIHNRTAANTHCPDCVGKAAIPGDTDLATLYPNVAREWDYEKNGELLPSQVLPGSGKRVWWICENRHCEKRAIYLRAFSRGCKVCNRYRTQTSENTIV